MEILIVEDEAIIAESLFQLLLMLNYKPLEPVATPEDAIDVITNQSPKLVILDVTLQNGRTGLEVAEYIDNNKLKIPYIILTAHSDANTINLVKKYNPESYLVKPFSRENLFAAIEMAIPILQPDDIDADDDNSKDSLFLKMGTHHEKINVKEIKYLQAQGKYTKLHMPTGSRLVRMSLIASCDYFNVIKWLRVHKSFCVNPDYITKVGADFIWIGEEKIPVGRMFQEYVDAFVGKE